jgi:VCBS repeat-containing protein
MPKMRKPTISTLEPRILFDGAAVETAVDVLDNSSFENSQNSDNTQDTNIENIYSERTTQKKDVVFIDNSLENYDFLVDKLSPYSELFLIDNRQDGLIQIDNILSNMQEVDSIHILAHGSDSNINIGSSSINKDNLSFFYKQLEGIGSYLSEDGDILLYGCNIASSEDGKDLINDISTITKADIAASDDITGIDGDWQLEHSVGSIETASFVFDEYSSNLATLEYADMNNWTADGDLGANWQVQDGGRTVYQSENVGETFFINDADKIDIVLQGTITVDANAGDDDFIGFTLGYQDTDNNIVFAWDRTSNNSGGGLGEAGWGKELWQNISGTRTHLDTDLSTTDNSKGWEPGVTYDFRMLYTSDNIKVQIDGETIFDVSGSFSAGKYGFFNSSQGGVTYGNAKVVEASTTEVVPTVGNDTYGMDKNTTLNVDKFSGLLSNDYDGNLDEFYIKVNGQNLTTDSANTTFATTNGNVTVYGDGSFSYSPNNGYQGLDSFTYTLVDNDGESDTSTVTFSVMEPNKIPTDISIDNIDISEIMSNGSVVGNLSTTDGNSDDIHDYMLIDSSNGRFKISGNQLIINDDTQIIQNNSYDIIVRTTDLRGASFDKVFTISSVNSAPEFTPYDEPDTYIAGLISEFEITEDPPATALALNAGEQIDVGVYGFSTESAYQVDRIVEIYGDDYTNGITDIKATKITTQITTEPDVDLLIIFQPDRTGNQMSQDEIDSISAYLDKGGRILFVAENPGATPDSNATITDAIARLGGSISILDTYSSDGLSDNTGSNKNLNNSQILAGVTTFNHVATAQLQIDSALSQAIIVNDTNKIVMAEQAILNGRITIIADQNWLDAQYMAGNDNETVLKNMAIDSVRNMAIVDAGGDPNDGFAVSNALAETNSGLTTTGTRIISDINTSDEVDITFDFTTKEQFDKDDNSMTLDTNIPSDVDLLSMFSITPNTTAISNSETTKELTWTFDSNGEAFDYLSKDEKLIFTYTLTATDSQGNTDTQDVKVVVIGTNDTPTISNYTDTDHVSLSNLVGSISMSDLVASDVDTSNNLSFISFSNQVTTVVSSDVDIGTVKISMNSSGEYTLSGADIQNLSVGETAIISFEVQVKDDSDDSASNISVAKTVTVTIDGENTAPEFTPYTEPTTYNVSGLISQFEITEDPPTTALALNPGEQIDIGIYSFSVDSILNSYIDDFVNIYGDSYTNGITDIKAEYISTELTSEPTVDLLIIVAPDRTNNKMSQDEIDALSDYLDKGGRILFVAENPGATPQSNETTTDAIARLGGNMSILDTYSSDNLSNNSGSVKNLNNSPILAGVTNFNHVASAQLQIDSEISKAIIVNDSSNIVMADQAILNGRITLIADINWVTTAYDNEVVLKNLAIDSVRNMEIVSNGGSPNDGFSATVASVETNSSIISTGTRIISDINISDEVDITFDFTTKEQFDKDDNSMTLDANVPSDTDLLSMFSITPNTTAISNSETTKELTWTFNSNGEAFDFLSKGEKLIFTYTLTATDTQGDIDTQDVKVVIIGTNDTPIISDYYEVDDIYSSNLTDSISMNDMMASDIDKSDIVSFATFTNQIATIVTSDTDIGTIKVSMNSSGNYTIIGDNIDNLGLGEQATVTFTVQVKDNSGDTNTDTSVEKNVTVTINGTNNKPVISDYLETDDVQENILSGAITLLDMNLTDTNTNDLHEFIEINNQTVNIISSSVDIGTVTVSMDENGNYTISGNDIAKLSVGESAQISFEVQVKDDSGDVNSDTSIAKTITLIIDGTNSSPTIQSVDVNGTITEGSVLSDSGSITFTDIETSNRPVATYEFKSINALANDGVTPLTLTIGQVNAIENGFGITNVNTNTNNGEVTWNYEIKEDKLNFLAQDETVTLVYTITVTDDDGASASQDVTVVITGSNDTPIITPIDIDATIVENSILSDSGKISFSDVDLTNRPMATQSVKSITALHQDGIKSLSLTNEQQNDISNAFSIKNINTNTNSGEVTWSYDISEDKLNFLGQGEVVTAIFTITVTDDSLASVTEDITVTIKGTNDNPIVDTNANLYEKISFGDKIENKDISFVFSDVDLTDVFEYSANSLPKGLSIDKSTGVISGQVLESGNFTITLTAIDSEGKSATRTFDMLVLAPPKEIVDNSEEIIENFEFIDIQKAPIPSEHIKQDDIAGTINEESNEVGIRTNPGTGFVDTIKIKTSEVIQDNIEVKVTVDGIVNFEAQRIDNLNKIGMALDKISLDDKLKIKIVDMQKGQIYKISQKDGKPLPNGIKYNQYTGYIEGDVKGIEKLDIMVQALDASGKTRVLNVTVNISDYRQDIASSDISDNTFDKKLQKLKDDKKNYGDKIYSLFSNKSSKFVS